MLQMARNEQDPWLRVKTRLRTIVGEDVYSSWFARLEIESLSGEIIRRAQIAALPVPRTRVIYQLIRGMESR